MQVHNLTIRAKGKVLLESTMLTVTAGRRYGLVGPNGKGKSTLLRMIARRQVPVPETLDVLLVEQVRARLPVLASHMLLVEQLRAWLPVLARDTVVRACEVCPGGAGSTAGAFCCLFVTALPRPRMLFPITWYMESPMRQ